MANNFDDSIKRINELRDVIRDLKKAFNANSKELEEQGLLAVNITDEFYKLRTSARKFYDLQEDLKNSYKATNKILKEKGRIEKTSEVLNIRIKEIRKQLIKTTGKEAGILKRQLDLLSSSRDEAESLAEEYENIARDAQAADKATRGFGIIADITKHIPGLRTISEPFREAESAARTTFLQTKSIREGAAAGFKHLGSLAKKAIPILLLTTAVKIIKFFVDAMFKASENVANLSRNFLISKEAARETLLRVKELSLESEGVYISSERYLESLFEINDQLGFQLNLANDFGDRIARNVTDVAMLKRQLGLSAEAQTRLLLDAEKQNVSTKELTKSIGGRLEYLSIESGLQVDIKKTLEEVLTTSGNLRANYKGNTEAIAQAVYQSKLLGFNLKELEGISRRLLDFESSISAELEAELLIGKQLNLEQARYYALMGKTEKVAEELTAQGISYSNFTNMNLIQRDALAKSMGMETDQLADQLQKREDNLKLQKAYNMAQKEGLTINGKEITNKRDLVKSLERQGKTEKQIRDFLGDQVYERIKNQSAQEEFNDALDRAKETFTSFVTGGTLDALAEGLENLTEILFGDKIRKRKGEENEEKARELLAEDEISKEDYRKVKEASEYQESGFFKKVLTSLLGGPLGSMYTIYNTQKKKSLINKSEEILNPSEEVDDFIIRPGQKPIKFNKGDLIMGGTNLDKGSSTTNQLLERLVTAVEKGGNVYIDGAKVGQTTVLASSQLG